MPVRRARKTMARGNHWAARGTGRTRRQRRPKAVPTIPEDRQELVLGALDGVYPNCQRPSIANTPSASRGRPDPTSKRSALVQ